MLLIILVMLLLASVILDRQRRADLRLRNLERRIERGLSALGVETEESHVPTARQLVADGEMRLAVRLWRDATGAGSTEAKRAIERLKTGTEGTD